MGSTAADNRHPKVPIGVRADDVIRREVSPSMTLHDRSAAGPIARPDVTLQQVGREAILHDAANGQAHVINGSAARLWELCDGRPLDELVRAFAALYGREPETVADDVERTLAGFRALGLLA
jgi:PqqD family protein of HPr-rel-A system